jgi:SPP1 gp7 family putative phage head morphogenesis protein
LALKVEELVIDGIVRGRGWGRTAAELRRETGLTRWKAEQLVRTESVSASAASRTDTFRSNGVEAEQVLCTMDDRLCAWCASRAGRAYKLGEIELPFHPNCRCTTIPYRPEWRELGLTDDDWMTEHRRASLARADGPPKTGPTPWERQRGLTKAPEPIWSP